MVAKKHQELIMVVENCVPVQHEAHIREGNTNTARNKCALAIFDRIGAARVGQWYTSLWQEEGLSVNRGILVPPRDMRIRQLIPLMNLGAKIHGRELPEEGWERDGHKGKYDVRAQIVLSFQGRRRKWKEALPKSHNGYTIRDLISYLDDGYWANYMCHTLGIDLSLD